MSAIQIEYSEARKLMLPGDVIAFGGKGHFSEIIKSVTFSEVSHVGIILQSKMLGETGGRFFNEIIESTSLNGFNGVNRSRFSDRISSYEGDLWWLPLSQEVRSRFDTAAFFNFMLRQDRKPYDTKQAILSALDFLPDSREDFDKMYCSELDAAGLEAAGAIPPVNASSVTPIDLCRWDIYADSYFQLKGDPSKKISRFNTADPKGWR